MASIDFGPGLLSAINNLMSGVRDSEQRVEAAVALVSNALTIVFSMLGRRRAIDFVMAIYPSTNLAHNM